MHILISILRVFLGLHVLPFNIYCYLIVCTEACAEAFAKFRISRTCVRFSPHAFYLEEKVEVFAAEALRNPEVNTLQFGSPLQQKKNHLKNQ